jgi:hypothetical protein
MSGFVHARCNVRNSRRFRWIAIAFVCLGFTGADVGWADPADDYVPTAPHSDDGTTVRLGTAVGALYGTPASTLALGATIAIGQRFGRLGLEGEYTYLDLLGHGEIMTPTGIADGDVAIGSSQRLAAVARYDLIRFGPRADHDRSVVTLYVEGGAGQTWNRFTQANPSDPTGFIPNATSRTEALAGFGLMIFPHRVAWLIGWRFALAPHQTTMGTECRADGIDMSCSEVPMTSSGGLVDQSMLFQSSLEFTF